MTMRFELYFGYGRMIELNFEHNRHRFVSSEGYFRVLLSDFTMYRAVLVERIYWIFMGKRNTKCIHWMRYKKESVERQKNVYVLLESAVSLGTAINNAPQLLSLFAKSTLLRYAWLPRIHIQI